MSASATVNTASSTSIVDTISAPLQLAARIIFAYIFITAGYGKLMSHDGSIGYIASGHLPVPVELAYWAAVAVELGGGVLIAIGLLTRPAALAVAIFTFVAALYFHLPYANGTELVNILQGIHFQKNISMAGAALFIAATGAGAWSLDALIFGKRG